MAVKGPGFSERVFEFSFNAEYAAHNHAMLAGAPSIPTQNEEKWLGYDVAFELKRRGGAVHLVALQHKVARFVDTKTGSNDHFWSEVGGEYYAFRLDSAQYNLIESMSAASLPGIEFYYCAPLFATREDMSAHFLARSVEPNSVWIDVAKAESIEDDALHSIVYSKDGVKAVRFSNQAKDLTTKRHDVRVQEHEKRRATERLLAASELDRIYTALFEKVLARGAGGGRRSDNEAVEVPEQPNELPRKCEPTIVNIARLLAEHFGSSLLVEVRK